MARADTSGEGHLREVDTGLLRELMTAQMLLHLLAGVWVVRPELGVLAGDLPAGGRLNRGQQHLVKIIHACVAVDPWSLSESPLAHREPHRVIAMGRCVEESP